MLVTIKKSLLAIYFYRMEILKVKEYSQDIKPILFLLEHIMLYIITIENFIMIQLVSPYYLFITMETLEYEI